MWIGLTGIVVILLFAYFSGVLRGAPYVPTPLKTVDKMIRLAEIKPGDKLADLGSGDGRIVIAAALAGAQAQGFEINPLLVLWARNKIGQAGLQTRASISSKNFWLHDLSVYDVITIFGTRGMMPTLEKKFARELKPGTRVVCNIFPLPTWQGTQDGAVYKYLVK